MIVGYYGPLHLTKIDRMSQSSNNASFWIWQVGDSTQRKIRDRAKGPVTHSHGINEYILNIDRPPIVRLN